jgi:photosystem II stability/assembly factor-like uncharacterized protein
MSRRTGFLALALVAVLVGAGLVFGLGGGTSEQRAATACKGGERESAEEAGREHEAEEAAEEAEREAAEERAREGGERTETGGLFGGGPEPVEPPCGERPGLPETYADLAKANSSRASRDVAPGTELKPGAYRAAVREKRALPVADGVGEWKPYGRTPLETDRTEYDTSGGSTNQGHGGVSGRANVIVRDPDSKRLFVGPTEGGVFTSTDNGDTWQSIGENLPTQSVSGLAWTTAGGGTLLALTGDNSFGGGTKSGLGAYYTNDLGGSWKHAEGIPDGLLAFRLAVDPTDPSKVYAATGGGLFRSTDGGKTYANVNLPTGTGQTPDCTGRPVTVRGCYLANVVTDVVVQGGANAQSAGGKPGAVLAAVGWRAGNKPNEDGTIQSPGNGLYRSDTGAPDTFTNIDFASNAIPKTDPLTQARIGRIALGGATGADQNHQVVYAIVQDAVKFNGGVAGLDVNENGTTSAAQSDFLNGIWASTDFGSTWRQLEGSTIIDNDLTSGSALAPPVCKAPVLSYCPGIQAWYNLHVAPDPTRQTAAGIPTRLVFGLEELWEMSNPLTGLDGNLPVKATVVGRYFAGDTCTFLIAANGLPVCPAAQGGQVPETTTHPDQHGILWVPDGNGGVTLFAGNDGGIYKQSTDAAGALSNDNWGKGANVGLNTLQPYDVAVAKDGTAYFGLQDNGEGKVDPDGRTYTVFGGDAFFTAVDPDKPDVAYEEYVGGTVSATQDGGKTWTDIDPALINPGFVTPLEMDPKDPKHLIIAGCDVRETTAGPSTAPGSGTTDNSWRTVFELGTQAAPGSACPTSPLPVDPTAADIPYQASALDVQSAPAPSGAATGPHTADFAYTGGAGTIPGPTALVDSTVVLPGTFDDHPFTIAKNEGDAAFTVDVTWEEENFDWDVYVLKVEADGTETEVGQSATSEFGEHVRVVDPGPGDYVIRVVNFAAAGTFDAKVAFEQRSSDAQTSAAGAPSSAYVGYCGFCDTITQGTPFDNGIATNVGGDKPGKGGSGDGWHIAKAAGLPKRYITSVRMDPSDPKTVYVTLGGYARKWAAPGAVADDVSKIGTGHVFKSTDAGETFKDISGDLPDTPANWTVLHNDHLVIGTDLGVFESCDTNGGDHSALSTGMPNVQVASMMFKPGDADTLVAATYGRGLYSLHFNKDVGLCSDKADPDVPPTQCATTAGFKSVKVRPKGKGLRFAVERAVEAPFRVDVYRSTRGRKVTPQRRVAKFRNKTKSFTWAGKGKKIGNGIYFARVLLDAGAIHDARRPAFVRSNGRFKRRRPFYALAQCKLLQVARLRRPAFGGTNGVKLGITARLTEPGSVRFVVKRGRKTVAKKRVASAGAGAAQRLRVKPKGLKRGEYRVTIRAKSGKATETVTLAARRL